MPYTHDRRNGASRRGFLTGAASVATGVAANVAASSVLAPGAQAQTAGFHRIDPQRLISPATAAEWNLFKARGGPTYAGGAGWKRYTDFLLEKLGEYGAVDLETIDIPYDHYIVDDWPDRGAHVHDSGRALEKLVSDGAPVSVVASYGMTSGFTPPGGVTAPMLYYDPSHPPAPAEIAGKILVCATAPYPAPPYSNAFLDNYTLTDYEWRSPGEWAPLFTPPPNDVTTSYHGRWVWNHLNRFAAIGIAGKAAGLVVVYDLSPGAAFGLIQRSVYTGNGKAGLDAKYINCPTLALDRVHGAKVLADAKAGKTATLTLTARFQRDVGRAFITHLPGKNYGTPDDEQVLLATHTDAMSLIEENGGLGMLAMLSYFNKIDRAARDRTLVLYFDCRHFMPGGEGSWPQFDYYHLHPQKLKSLVATVGIEHMGGRQTIETGAGGNDYQYSSATPWNGGVITSLMDVNNNNEWLVQSIARAATDNRWPRVDVKAGPVAPGVNGGFQGKVKSPMNKGRELGIPGVGLAGDWPGGWTQTFAQIDTEAGAHGFDADYFMQQVAGLTQITGDLLRVKPLTIDLGWGELKSSLANLGDNAFNQPADAATTRKALLDEYRSVFKHVETGDIAAAKPALQQLAERFGAKIAASAQAGPRRRMEAQIAKLV